LKSEKSVPSFRFGSEKREWISKNEIPGPGQYKIPCAIVDVVGYQRSTGGFDSTYRFV
jgi:hypothetical protein